MNTRVIITIILGTFLLFIWNAVSWMTLPFHENSLTNIPDELIDREQLKSLMPESGVYHYPGMPNMNSPEALAQVEKQLEEGPRITLMVYKNAPSTLFDPMDFVVSLLLNFLMVLFTYFVIAQLVDKNVKSILFATTSMALLVIIINDLSLMNWFSFPFDYTFANIIDRLVGFTILGLLFGYFTFRTKPA